jgi:antitoxin YefM
MWSPACLSYAFANNLILNYFSIERERWQDELYKNILTLIKYYHIVIVQYFVHYFGQIRKESVMLAVNYSTVRNNLKTYCDEASDNGETVIVTRKEEKNIVIMSLEKYNQLEKAAKNAEYLSIIDRSMEQLASGKGQMHELIEVDEHE